MRRRPTFCEVSGQEAHGSTEQAALGAGGRHHLRVSPLAGQKPGRTQEKPGVGR